MNKNIRDKIQAANELRTQLIKMETDRASQLTDRLEHVVGMMQRCQETQRRLAKCSGQNLPEASKRLQQRARHSLGDLRSELDLLLRRFDQEVAPIPSVRDLVNEIDQLEDEFVNWQWDKKKRILSVTTDSIELEGMYLGPFEIKLLTNELADTSRRQAFLIEALDPHPASESEGVTHPHVRDEMLCTGEASSSISATLEAGRIADFFLVVRSVLTTYNPESPYVSLENWSGEPCADCGYYLNDENRYFCEECEEHFCDECMGGCPCCDLSICHGCLSQCNSCDDSVCKTCLSQCSRCEETCCKSCLEDDLCPDCLEQKENEDETQESQEETTPAKTSQKCADTTQAA